MKYLFGAILLMVCLFTSTLKAQNTYSIKGTVVDTAANTALFNTSVSVLNSKDSTLVKFTRAANDGSFTIDNLKPGKFILLLTYTKYADFVERFVLDSTKRTIDFKKINMVLKSKLLADVIVKGQVAAIKIKGDTTEYNADSFKIEPNAKVEDLLRQLPGIQVDGSGKITAQGQTVNKVLVDGEEFFGDDPTLVTKNLRGDMVDKVQLYDKKSDQATFTGIDDGIKTKTINLKLKEDKKNGYFGKVDAGGANDEFYQGQAMINAFKAKRKAAAYATVSNTAKVGLGWEDNNKYGGSTQDYGDEGFAPSRDELQYNGQGIPSVQSGGAHYDAKWNSDKESINTNYKAGALTIDGIRNNLTQTNLPLRTLDGLRDSAAITNFTGEQRYNNYTFRQKLDATYQLKIDTTSNLKIIVDGTLRDARNSDNNVGLTLRENDIQQNNNVRNFNNETSQHSFFASVFYNKKLKKKGRTFSVSVSQTLSESEDEGVLYAKTNFYNNSGVFDREEVVDQLKVTNSKSFRVNSNVTYTEPITQKLSLVLNYGLNHSASSSDRRSFNKDGLGRYETLDTEFSNNFEYNQLSNNGGAVFNYRKGKSVINFGTKIDGVSLEQIDLYQNRSFDRHFININPQASFQYRESQFKSFRINYFGNTNQPSINQLQPVRVNDNPLNIYIGNRDLKASFRNGFNINYNSFKVLGERYIHVGGFYGFVLNQVVDNTTTDLSTGASTRQSLNLTDKAASNFSFNGNYGKKINKLGFSVGLDVSISGSRNFNYINSVLNTVTSNSYFAGLTARHYIAKKYNFWTSIGPSYNSFKSSLQSRVNNSGGGFRANGNFSVQLPRKFEISSNYEYNFTGKTETFNEDVDYLIVNSAFSKKFLKKESLKLSVSGNDLLNQNLGFHRNSNGNTFYQNSYNTIRRYYMVSLLWDFNKMGGGIKTQK